MLVIFRFLLVLALVAPWAVAEPAALECAVSLHEIGVAVTATVRRLRTSEVRPLQMEVGDEAVELMLLSVVKNGEPRAIQKFLDTKPLPAVVLPNREVRILDGHHRARLMAMAETTGYAGRDELTVAVEIKRDFAKEGYTMERALRELDGTRNLYVTREVRRSVQRGEITWEATLIRHLPASVYELKDNARRSLMGAALREMKIDSTHYANFVEFFLAEELESRGFDFPTSISLRNRDLIARVVARLEESDMRRYLETFRLPAH